MSKSDPAAMKKERNKTIRWVVTIFFVTVFVTSTISLLSDYIMRVSGMVVAFSILLCIVIVGIIFDIIGVAVTSADEKPFHSMASRKVTGALESIRLLRKAGRVSSICNDVIGDICGVISGSASATIAAHMSLRLGEDKHMIIGLVMSGLVAGLTVGGKALGKSYAIGSCTKIVTFAGKFIYFIHHPVKTFQKKNK